VYDLLSAKSVSKQAAAECRQYDGYTGNIRTPFGCVYRSYIGARRYRLPVAAINGDDV